MNEPASPNQSSLLDGLEENYVCTISGYVGILRRGYPVRGGYARNRPSIRAPTACEGAKMEPLNEGSRGRECASDSAS